MKRIFVLVFLFVLLAPVTAEARSMWSRGRNTQFNLYAIGNFHHNTYETTIKSTRATSETEDDAEPDLGFGLSAEFMTGKKMSFELGVAYVQRKSETKTALTGISTRASKLSFDVIEIPAILHFWLSNSVSIGLGGYAGIASNDADTAKTEFGATGALRLFLFDMLFLGGRYNYGITDIAKTSTTTRTTTQKNQGFYVLGGLQF